MIRVKVYSSLPAVRAGLDRLLEGEPDTVILPPGGEPPGHERPGDESPDVAVLAEEVSWRGVLAELLAARVPPAGFLLVSDDAPECRHLAAQATGGWGVLPPGVTPGELKAAVRSVAEGLVVVHPALAPILLAAGGGDTDPKELLGVLTDREREVLDLLSKGFTNPEIAGLLGISEHTVKFHTSSLYTKLGVANRTEAVRAGIRSGAIHL